jgi:uncharacterized RDD family membrane protein YckC
MSDLDNSKNETHDYPGFWLRLISMFFDNTLLLILFTAVLLGAFKLVAPAYFGMVTVVFSLVFPIPFYVLFWMKKGATPGKLVLKQKVVDAKTGELPSMKQSIIRYFGYTISLMPLFLGFIWIAFDKKKQGWHDKLAGTVVIRS